MPQRPGFRIPIVTMHHESTCEPELDLELIIISLIRGVPGLCTLAELCFRISLLKRRSRTLEGGMTSHGERVINYNARVPVQRSGP